MFTKEHFKKVAQVLRDSRISANNDDFATREEIVDQVAAELANVFADSNPRFDHGLFLAACASESYDDSTLPAGDHGGNYADGSQEDWNRTGNLQGRNKVLVGVFLV